MKNCLNVYLGTWLADSAVSAKESWCSLRTFPTGRSRSAVAPVLPVISALAVRADITTLALNRIHSPSSIKTFSIFHLQPRSPHGSVSAWRSVPALVSDVSSLADVAVVAPHSRCARQSVRARPPRDSGHAEDARQTGQAGCAAISDVARPDLTRNAFLALSITVGALTLTPIERITLLPGKPAVPGAPLAPFIPLKPSDPTLPG